MGNTSGSSTRVASFGGKPVPLVGWVLVERLPVREPTSRRSVKHGGVVAKALPAASPRGQQAHACT